MEKNNFCRNFIEGDYGNGDIAPEFCITYSPNWSKNQVVSLEGDMAVFGVNDQLVLLDAGKRKVIAIYKMDNEEVLKKIKKSCDKKISCLLLADGYILFWNSYGCLCVLEFEYDGNELKKFSEIFFGNFRFEGVKTVTHMEVISIGDAGIMGIFVNEENEFYTFGYDFESKNASVEKLELGYPLDANDDMDEVKESLSGEEIRDKFSKIGQVFCFKNPQDQELWIINSDRGVLLCVDLESLELSSTINLEKKIINVDILFAPDQNYFLVAFITLADTLVIGIVAQKKFRVIFEKEILFKKNSLKNVKIVNKNNSKFSAPNIKWIDQNTILVTSITGDIFSLDLKKLKNIEKIILQPFNTKKNLKNNAIYHILEESPHTRSIYQIEKTKIGQNFRFLFIGIDRIMSLFELIEDEERRLVPSFPLKLDLSIEFLSSKIKKLVRNPVEKQFCCLLAGKSMIKLWDMSKKVRNNLLIFLEKQVRSYLLLEESGRKRDRILVNIPPKGSRDHNNDLRSEDNL